MKQVWKFLSLLVALTALAVAAEFVVGRETYLRFLGLYGLLFPAYAALALRTGRVSD